MTQRYKAPFNLYWVGGLESAGSHTIQTKAYDIAGNVGASEVRTVKAVPTSNLAFNKTATGSTPLCGESIDDYDWAKPGKAVDGIIEDSDVGYFCSVGTNNFLQVDLGSSKTLGRIVIHHDVDVDAYPTYNTQDFNIQFSDNGTDWRDSGVSVSGNTKGVTEHLFTPASARYVKLNLITPNGFGNSNYASITEFEVYGPPPPTPPPPTPPPTTPPPTTPPPTTPPPTTPPKTGDINGDGKMNISDLSRLLSAWGTSDTAADVDKSGTVDIKDLSKLLGNWG